MLLVLTNAHFLLLMKGTARDFCKKAGARALRPGPEWKEVRGGKEQAWQSSVGCIRTCNPRPDGKASEWGASSCGCLSEGTCR
jgi:hypothetical protein